MTILFILIVSIILLSLAYRFYSPIIQKILGVEPDKPTPAHTMQDGVDYYPAKAPVLFGHHFASIAGAAPIVGPVIAAAYGWGPVWLWILVGGIFMGATHDFAALVASIRHGGHSMGELIERYVGRSGKLMFIIFLWSTLVLLIAAYFVVVAKTFVTVPSAATASVLFILLAVLFGFLLYRLKLPLVILSIIGIIVLAICMVIGWHFPLELTADTWIIILIVYTFIASVTPVWILLQPRDYLNSFLLYALLICAIAGVFAAHPGLEMPFFTAWSVPKLGPLFPILFVTVACGAISGYHSVVASGTTAKQLDHESEARTIGYGGMIVESLLAILALISVMYLTKDSYSSELAAEGPVTVFSKGIGYFMSKFGIDHAHGMKFAALAVSAFVLTTLDTATRLARFAFQEFFAPKRGDAPSVLNRNRFIGTTVTVGAAAALAFSGHWKDIWPIFGAANQMLAALALMAITMWLRSRGKRTKKITVPMVIMFIITLSALGVIFWKNIAAANYSLGIVAAVLFVLALIILGESVRVVMTRKN